MSDSHNAGGTLGGTAAAVQLKFLVDVWLKLPQEGRDEIVTLARKSLIPLCRELSET